jgi:hypothetical protein
VADTDPWAPDPIPETLPHKPYTLPAIGTRMSPRDPNDDLITWAVEFEREHGPSTVILQNARTEEWAALVTAYEKDPRNFANAWRYLDAHPIYYRFRYAPDEATDSEQIIQERHLAGHGGFGLYELYFKVSNWCAERCADDDCGHPTRDICWIETGPWTWPDGDKDHPAGCGTHDYRLDVYGDTYESCILQLAHKVWTLYGNDRALDGTANKFDDEVPR